MKRRQFLLLAAMSPVVLTSIHIHDWKPETGILGYSCDCGAIVSLRELRQARAN